MVIKDLREKEMISIIDLTKQEKQLEFSEIKWPIGTYEELVLTDYGQFGYHLYTVDSDEKVTGIELPYNMLPIQAMIRFNVNYFLFTTEEWISPNEFAKKMTEAQIDCTVFTLNEFCAYLQLN